MVKDNTGYLGFNVLSVLCLPRGTPNIFKFVFANFIVCYHYVINNIEMLVHNTMILRLRKLLTLNKLHGLRISDFMSEFNDSRVIYAILTHRRVYFGQTRNFRNRVVQHLSRVRSIFINSNSSRNTCLTVPKNSNTYLYKHLSKNNFVILPLFCVCTIDVLEVENVIIRQFTSTALNQVSEFDVKLDRKNIVYTRKNVKRKRQSRNVVGVGSTVVQDKICGMNKEAGKPNSVRLPLFYTGGLFYGSLLSLLSHNVNAEVIVTFHPFGRINCNLHICLCSFYDSCVMYKGDVLDMNILIRMIMKTDVAFTFTITPRRNNTLTELIYLNIKHNCTPRMVSSLLCLLDKCGASKLPVFFWIRLFKVAHNFNNSKITRQVRRFMKEYMFYFYNITGNEVNSAISCNISVPYSPCVDQRSLSLCHKLLLNMFVNDKYIVCNSYTTLTKNDSIAKLLLNHHDFMNKLSYDMDVECKCNTKNGLHRIVMPYEMDLMDEMVLRNVLVPKTDIPRITLCDITISFTSLISKLIVLSKKKLNSCSLCDVVIDKSKFVINIFLRTYSVFLSFNLNVFNMFLCVMSYEVDRHKYV